MAELMQGRPGEGSDVARARAHALVGRTLSDRYRVVSLVAMGNMGAIYRAEHLLMRKHVAVKVLHPEVEGFPELVTRFEREAVAGAHVEHPNVATASDFGKFDGGSAFLVLEFIEGIDLRQLIDRGPVPPPRAARIIRQAAAGLAAVHQKGIVHRDIKPKNIMIVEAAAAAASAGAASAPEATDVVKLIDFGLAKVPVEELSALAQDADNPRRSLTQAGVVLGTFGYLAPEAALGSRSILAPADLYALGIVFYELLCGKPPFEGTDPARVFLQHRTSPVPALRERNPAVDIPPALEAIVRRMLEKDPEARYPGAGALIAAIDEALANPDKPPSSASASPEPAPSVADTPFDAVPAPRSRRTGKIVAIVIAVALACAGLSVFVFRRQVGTAIGGFGTPASTATPSASAAPPPEPAPPRLPPAHAPGALERLRAAGDGDTTAALGVLVGLADTEPSAFADRAVQTEAASIIDTAATKRVPVDAACDRLASLPGSDGLDVLYDVVAREQRAADPSARPSGASKARTILGRPEVLARATPAMRVAFELRRAPCWQRPAHFTRAAKDGDDRALEILRSMQSPACTKKDPCCLDRNRPLELAIADIQARLRH